MTALFPSWITFGIFNNWTPFQKRKNYLAFLHPIPFFPWSNSNLHLSVSSTLSSSIIPSCLTLSTSVSHTFLTFPLLFLLKHYAAFLRLLWPAAIRAPAVEESEIKNMNQFLEFLYLFSLKSQMIREVLQRRMMGNYVGLEIYFTNLASPPSSSPILSVSPFLSEFLIIYVVLPLFFTSLSRSIFLWGAVGYDMCSDWKRTDCVHLIQFLDCGRCRFMC